MLPSTRNNYLIRFLEIGKHTERYENLKVARCWIYLPPSLAAGLAARYQQRVVRSPAAHAPGVRSGRSCHTLPTRPESLPGRPAAGSGRSSHTRLRQPAARSASGRVLSPPYADVWPTRSVIGARGQRASRPASGAHPTRGRPVCCVIRAVRVRPVHQPARAAKAPRGRHSDSHRKPPAAPPASRIRPTAAPQEAATDS